MKETQPVVLSVITRGSVDFPRYLIADQWLRYWTGEHWSEQKDEQEAIVYLTSQDALREIHRLMVDKHDNMPVYHFKAPVYIELFTSNKVSKEDLQQWLYRTTKLIVDSTKHGNGPFDGTYGAVRLELSELEEVRK